MHLSIIVCILIVSFIIVSVFCDSADYSSEEDTSKEDTSKDNHSEDLENEVMRHFFYSTFSKGKNVIINSWDHINPTKDIIYYTSHADRLWGKLFNLRGDSDTCDLQAGDFVIIKCPGSDYYDILCTQNVITDGIDFSCNAVRIGYAKDYDLDTIRELIETWSRKNAEYKPWL